MIHDTNYLAQQAYHWACGSANAVNRYASAIDMIVSPDEPLDPTQEIELNELFYRCVAGVDVQAPDARSRILAQAQAVVSQS